MKVSDLVPELYKNNVEMYNIINNEEQELEENLKPKIEQSFNNTFISSADEVGIEKFEKLFRIVPNPLIEDLEFRKQRLLNRLNYVASFTEEYMVEKINGILGEGNWNYTINYNTYTIQINSLQPGKSWWEELLITLDKIIPCNIDWNIQVYTVNWRSVKETYPTWNDMLEKTWENVFEGV